MNTYAIDLDLDKRANNNVIVMRQSDHNGTTITATLYRNGSPFTQSSLSAYFVMELPGGSSYYRKSVNYANGVVTAAVDEEYACAIPGRTDNAYIELHNGTSAIASTEPITVIVLPSATAGKTEGQRYDDEITAVITQWLNDHPEATTTVQDDSLTAAKLKANSVTTEKIVDSNVTTAKLADGSVTTPKLADAAVTTDKLGSSSVTTAKLANASVTADKIDQSMFHVVTDAEIAAMLN